jgi:beta-galactosidase
MIERQRHYQSHRLKPAFLQKYFVLLDKLLERTMRFWVQWIGFWVWSCAFGFIFDACSDSAPGRQVIDFTEDWRFILSDASSDFSAEKVDMSAWRSLDLPHDWSIEADFSAHYPATPGGGALPGGVGWYRKVFYIDKSLENKRVRITFDGIYRCSEVWINGHSLGFRPNGYVSFQYDLNPYLRIGKENVIAVRVDNSAQPNSRWYSGSGIYRRVRLNVTNRTHIDDRKLFVTTPNVTEKEAIVCVHAPVFSEEKGAGSAYRLSYQIKDVDGHTVAEVRAGEVGAVQEIGVLHPRLWSVDDPYLYLLVTQLEKEGRVVDRYETPFGVRSFVFDAEKGFILNGNPLKINGVCNHHDLGCLGAASNKRAIQRQLEILKEMGCNGIRCAHNPPAPELLDLCDEMGFIVMNEAFDMWAISKTEHDYAQFFSEWYEKDLTDFVLRDRNHPSVFIWSIGNEIGEQWRPAGDSLAATLAEKVRQLDPTRPILSACNEPRPENPFFRPGILEMIGLNYHLNDYQRVHNAFPDRPFIASETVSGLSSRGFYRMPSDSVYIWPKKWDIPLVEPVQQCSSYDNCRVPWGCTHEESLKSVKKTEFVAGQYVWTGFDYLGEPTPFGWPSRSSYFGIVDLAGFPKDIYYMYQSEWTDRQVLHIFPHWNWKSGETVDILAYYNHADEVELYLNNKSLGAKRKENGDLHVHWRVPFEPGVIRAVSRQAGQEILVRERQTTGEPVAIRLTADRSEIAATGSDLSFITVEVVDNEGFPIPVANDFIQFSIEGAGSITGSDNGDPTDCHSLKKPERHLFNGKCLVVVQGNRTPGEIRLTAHADGLRAGVLLIRNI